jgi:hypothetical protein
MKEKPMPAVKAKAKKIAQPAAKKPVKKTAQKVTLEDLLTIVADIGKAHKETEKTLKELQESHKETEKAIRETQRNIGGLNNTMGSLVEHIMTPDLPRKFKQFGFTFNRITNVKWAVEGNVYTEIDGLLENGTQAMAVEVKTTLRRKDIDDHLERMNRIRAYANEHGDRREFMGAMAAMIIDNATKTYALSEGLFIIEPSGEDVKIVKPAAQKVW